MLHLGTAQSTPTAIRAGRPCTPPRLMVLTKRAVVLTQLLRVLQAGQVVHTWPDVSFPAFLFACFLPRPF